MAINKNHEFEELNGVKCAIVEKNVTEERADFLNELLKLNKYKVVIVASPPPKAVPVSATNVDGVTSSVPPTTYTVGVTDVTFNPINAIFGRLLKTKDGRVVTLAFWQQKEVESHDDIPYFDKNGTTK